MPTVYIDREPMYLEGEEVVVVESDNVEGGYQATTEMIENGCKNVICISPEHNVSTHKNRYLGYRKAMDEAGLKSKLIKTGKISQIDGYEKAKKYIRENKNVDGIFSTTDIIAIGVMKALKELKIQVPKEVKVFGYDNSIASDIATTSISTVKQPIDEMVKIAVLQLEKLMNEVEVINKKIVLPIEIIKRESV